MRRGGGSGDVEGPRHAGNAYAGERVDVRHDLGSFPVRPRRLVPGQFVVGAAKVLDRAEARSAYGGTWGEGGLRHHG